MSQVSLQAGSSPAFEGFAEPLTGAAARAAIAVDPIDAQIRSSMHELESTNQRTEGLQSREQVLNALRSAFEASGTKSTDGRSLADITLQTVDGGSGPADVLLREADLIRFVDPDEDGVTTPATVQTVLDQFRGEREKITSNNQMRMIQLQDLMQQKNLLLQLATQELQSREQIERRIAENIR